MKEYKGRNFTAVAMPYGKDSDMYTVAYKCNGAETWRMVMNGYLWERIYSSKSSATRAAKRIADNW